MKKKFWWISGISIALVICAYFLFSNSITAQIPSASSYASTFKDWSVHFSEQMDPKTFTSETVNVVNQNKETVPVTLEWNQNFTVLTLQAPDKGYSLNQIYHLTISDNVETASGKNLNYLFTHSFKAVDDLPNINDKEQLITLLKERMKAKQQLFSTMEEKSVSVADNTSGNETASTGGASSPTSTTNVQVSGIDEGDSIKTDGDFIYFARDTDIVITRAANENSKYISKISEENFQPAELYLHDNALIAIGHSSKPIRDKEKNSSKTISIPVQRPQTSVFVYDISNRAEPKKVREVTVEGTLTASRKMDGHLYLIANERPPFQILQEGLDHTELRPYVKDTSVSDKGRPITFDDMYFFPESDEQNFLLLASLDLNNLKKKARVESYLGASQEMYMSKNHIYIAVRKYEPQKTKGSNDIMIARPANTEIIQFKVDEGKIKYNASTVVNGTLINQFAIDERDGTFRVATTKDDMWRDDKPSTNNVYTFDLNLNPLGSVEGLAKGERIYSVRFMDDVAYMVTFKQVDPLFVIDLKDPKNPKVLGQLKIPGFSNYLHPLDENHVIGFGQQTKLIPTVNEDEPMVRTDGIKISVFDVSDPTNPQEKYSEVIGQGGSYTELNHNHNVLYKHPEKNLFGFPAVLYEANTVQKGDATYEEQSFVYEGAFLYQITPKDGIVLKDTITHQQENVANHPEWPSEIRRLISVGDTLYTFSLDQMRVYDLSEEKALQTVELPELPNMY